VIACYVEDEIVGNCQINFNCSIKTSHRANIGIAILKEYWNLGIGSFMFEALIAAAETKRGVRTLELEFIEGNDRGKALYEKYGFQIVCVRPHAFQLKDGRLLNEYFMQKEIRR